MSTCLQCKQESATGMPFKIMTVAKFPLRGNWQSAQNNVLLGLYFKDFLPLEFWVCETCLRETAMKAKPTKNSATIYGAIALVMIVGAILYALLFHGNLIVSGVAGLIGIVFILLYVGSINIQKRFDAIGDIQKASIADVSKLLTALDFSNSIKPFIVAKRGAQPDTKLVENIQKMNTRWDMPNWAFWDFEMYDSKPLRLDEDGKLLGDNGTPLSLDV